MLNIREVEILECSLRDGSYAINFNFTAEDTALLAERLAKVGFNWIEIGHGFGLGAAQSGKGDMPNNDLTLLKAAKKVTKANIGMFYIPSLSSFEQLKNAASEGLDFIRIGANATDAEHALAHIEYAKQLGLKVGMNFMKSYAVSPKEFGRLSEEANKAGADIVYLVDSVGGMTPQSVEQYITEGTNRCNCEFGFHGHDNLKMAVANSLKAFECGARFLDATIMGIGRGAGNAPSEALVCLLEEMGVDTKVDIETLLNIADTYVWPLYNNLTMYNTKEVAMGYGKLHSSHLPKIIKASQKYNVDEKQLIIRMGKLDPVNVDDHILEEVAQKLKNTKNTYESPALISYPGLITKQDTISTNYSAITDLIKGIAVTCAKRKHAIPVLEIIFTKEVKKDFISTEYVWDSDRIILGRVTVGDFITLKEATKNLKGAPFKFIIDPQKSTMNARNLQKTIIELGSKNTFSINTILLEKIYIANVLSQLGNDSKHKSLLVYGSDRFIVEHLLKLSSFEQIIMVDPEEEAPKGVVCISNIEDWSLLNMKVDLIYTALRPNTHVEDILFKCISSKGKIITPHRNFTRNHTDKKYLTLNIEAAYEGVIDQISFTASAFLSE